MLDNFASVQPHPTYRMGYHLEVLSSVYGPALSNPHFPTHILPVPRGERTRRLDLSKLTGL